MNDHRASMRDHYLGGDHTRVVVRENSGENVFRGGREWEEDVVVDPSGRRGYRGTRSHPSDTRGDGDAGAGAGATAAGYPEDAPSSRFLSSLYVFSRDS